MLKGRRRTILRKLFICLKSLIAAPVMLVIAYLLSLPFYYFALTWQGGSRVSLLENFFVLAWAVVGFVAFRWLDRIFRDDGSGDLYLWSSILVVMAIVLFFRGNGSYAVNLGRKLYPEGIRYKSMLSFEEGVGWEEFADLMKFSSVYITIYEAAFCFLLAMFIRSVWNQRMPPYITKMKLNYYEWIGPGERRGTEGKKEGESKKDGEIGKFSFVQERNGRENKLFGKERRIYIIKKDWSKDRRV